MRRWWPYVFVLLICLPAAAPYLGGDIPRSNDSLTHLYRAVELDRLARSGVLFPRWAPGLAHGYGYPIFDYFAYFSHTLIVLFHLIGLPMLTALRAAYVAALLGSGVTAFLLGRELAGGDGEQAGVMAAVAYVYSPYLLYTAHVRGGLPESLALAFLPLAMWATFHALKPDRSSRPVKFSFILIAALAIAGFIFSHIGMALQYLPIIGVFGLYLIWRNHRANRAYNALLRAHPHAHTPTPPHPHAWDLRFGSWILGSGILFSIFALALGLTAFIWLPAMTELRYTQFALAYARTGAVYSNNFFYLSEIFNYPHLPVYADLLNPPLVRSLPLLAIALAVIGLFRSRSFEPVARADFFFIWALFAGATFLTVDLSKPVWDAIPLLQLSTLPWRFLGPATLFAAVLAGGAVGSGKWEVGSRKLEIGSWKLDVGVWDLGFWFFPLFIASALPFLYPPREPAPENPSHADLAKFEIPPLLVGTTTTGEYTPIWVAQFPDTSAQQAELISGREPERLQIPASAVMEHLSVRPADDVYRLSASEPFTAVYRSFYFPGWQMKIDGESAPIKITYPNGLISFDVPAGEHTVEVRFGTTPVRVVAGGVSVMTIVILLIALIRRELVAHIAVTSNRGYRHSPRKAREPLRVMADLRRSCVGDCCGFCRAIVYCPLRPAGNATRAGNGFRRGTAAARIHRRGKHNHAGVAGRTCDWRAVWDECSTGR